MSPVGIRGLSGILDKSLVFPTERAYAFSHAEQTAAPSASSPVRVSVREVIHAAAAATTAALCRDKAHEPGREKKKQSAGRPQGRL